MSTVPLRLGTTLGPRGARLDPAPASSTPSTGPVLSRVKLISEPWDIGPGGYTARQSIRRLCEWNDRFRDGIRRYWRGDEGQRQDFAARLAGSADFFDKQARRPWASITSPPARRLHPADTVSYAERHTRPTARQRGRPCRHYSANWARGTMTIPPSSIRAAAAARTVATVSWRQGTPMVAGRRRIRSLAEGNNNAYCQVNSLLARLEQAESEEGRALARFAARLAVLRRHHAVLPRAALHARPVTRWRG